MQKADVVVHVDSDVDSNKFDAFEAEEEGLDDIFEEIKQE